MTAQVADSPLAAPPLKASIERFITARIEGATSVELMNFAENTEGFSQETFSFDAVLRVRGKPDERRAYVLKRKPAAGLLEPYDLEPEFRVLHTLGNQGLLAPPAPWYEPGESPLSRPFYVMERLPGEVPIPAPNADGSGPFDEAERAALAPQVARELARLHAVDWRALGLGFLQPVTNESVASRELRRWRDRAKVADLGDDPMLEYAMLWLDSHRPDDDARCLVHGDYRTGNFLVTRNGRDSHLTGVLDWEMVHVGDPIEDLGWAVSRLWRAQGPYASCLAEPAAFIRLYEDAAGHRVDPARLRFYEVLSIVKMMAIMLTGIRAFLDGRTRDVRMATFDSQIPMLRALLAIELGILPGA
jgi:aminoglycoside phosphotransferase (APT) family kinase protein